MSILEKKEINKVKERGKQPISSYLNPSLSQNLDLVSHKSPKTPPHHTIPSQIILLIKRPPRLKKGKNWKISFEMKKT